MNTNRNLEMAIENVCAVFKCEKNDVEITFGFMRNEPWWSIRVRTAKTDRRFKGMHETSGSGETLDEALRACVERADTHRMWG